MTIVSSILQQMPAVRQPQRKFLIVLFTTILALRGRVTGRNLSRYCAYSERTIARKRSLVDVLSSQSETRMISAPVPCRVRESGSLYEEEGMQPTSNGHVQRSAAQWREIIARYRQSGLAMKEFCAQEGLTYRTFEEWERRQRRAERSKG